MEDKEIIELIRREVVPATGCTEPVAVALCCAYSAEALGMRPEKINLKLSANILKNAMGVGIPGTGMTGLPIAVALGEFDIYIFKQCFFPDSQADITGCDHGLRSFLFVPAEPT